MIEKYSGDGGVIGNNVVNYLLLEFISDCLKAEADLHAGFRMRAENYLN